MKKCTKLLCLTVAVLATLAMIFGCTSGNLSQINESDDSDESVTVTQTAASAVIDGFDMSFSDRDLDPSYSESGSTKITFSDTGTIVAGNGAVADGCSVTVSSEGTYIISGSCGDGCIRVDAGDNDKIQLVFSSLTLTSASASPLIVANAGKVFLTLADGSTSSLTDASDYELTVNESTVDAAIFSKADLTINGGGALTVNGQYKHGIVSKDDLVIAGGTISVTSVSTAVDGKNCVKMTGCTVNVDSGTNAIRSTNEDDTSCGFVYIADGTYNITAGTDGISGVTCVAICGGTLNITSGGGSANASYGANQNEDWGMWGGGMAGGMHGAQPGMDGSMPDTGSDMPSDFPANMPTDAPTDFSTDIQGGSAPVMQQPTSDTSPATSDATSTSAKGIKCDNDIVISGGTFTIDSSDDSIHANNNVTVSDGTITIDSGDDGFHADAAMTISGGNITVNKSYEGIEGSEIVISGGTIYVEASDDGLNAAGGNDSSSVSGRAGMNPFDADSSKSLTISGGYLVINASGDGLDSNGTLTVTGGVTLVSGPTNDGNSALDYGSDATISGGVLLAAGSSGMAESFSDSSAQGTIITDVTSQSGGTTVALFDGDGRVLVSFTPMKQFTNIVVSTPDITSGSTYTISACAVPDADSYGYSTGGTADITKTLATVNMTSLHYGTSGGMGGGMGGMGGGKNKNF